MTLRNQLSRRLLALVAMVLGLVLLAVYLLVNRQWEVSFRERLKQEAVARGVLWMETSPGAGLGTLRSGSRELTESPSVFWVYNYQNRLLWNEDSAGQIAALTQQELSQTRRDSVAFFRRGDLELAAVAFASDRYNRMMVVWGYRDLEGKRQLGFLRWILMAGWILGMGLTGLFSYWFSGKALSPVSHLLDRVEGIQTSAALDFHLAEANRPDEIGRLARKFNEFMARLAEAVRSQQKFLGLASHQLRTPLASTKASLEVLLRKSRTEDEYRVGLEKTLLSLDELNRTAHRLLVWVQLDAGSHTMQRTEVPMDELLVQIQSSWKRHLPQWEFQFRIMTNDNSSFDKKGRELERDEQIERDAHGSTNLEGTGHAEDQRGAEIFRVLGDAELLRTAVDNLIENAVKYSQIPKVNLDLAWIEDEGKVLIRIRDYGRGMDQETLQRIYEPFYRSSDSVDRSGHGLGLALVYQIVKWHGGSIHASSEPGHGSTFSIELPPIFGHV
jgi:signal transduction histidine kinase